MENTIEKSGPETGIETLKHSYDHFIESYTNAKRIIFPENSNFFRTFDFSLDQQFLTSDYMATAEREIELLKERLSEVKKYFLELKNTNIDLSPLVGPTKRDMLDILDNLSKRLENSVSLNNYANMLGLPEEHVANVKKLQDHATELKSLLDF